MTTDTYIDLNHAREDADRLSKILKRDIEPVPVTCDCDFFKGCYRCEGSGTFFELRYVSCGHVVEDDNDLECEEGDCAFQEWQEVARRENEEAA